MAGADGRTVAVVGATGLQGRAVTRRLLGDGWDVRALTRKPGARHARALAALAATPVHADMDDPGSLVRAFTGAAGVFSVQNHRSAGYEAEVRHGRAVGDAAVRAGVDQLVFSSAGTGSPGTGVGSWETKERILEHLRTLDVPLTVLRPMAFMELMTEAKFFPAASVWHVMPRLLGAERPVGWLAVDDLAAVVARALTDPATFTGMELPLVADVRTIPECRALWQEVNGRPPRRMALPVGVFERMAGTDETTMWRWLRDHEIDLDPGPTRAVLPEALTVRAWLEHRRQAARSSRRPAPAW